MFGRPRTAQQGVEVDNRPWLPGFAVPLALAAERRCVIRKPLAVRGTSPVLDFGTRNSRHVVDVGGDEYRILGKSVSGDCRVKVLDPLATPFEHRLDRSKLVAHGIGPARSRQLDADEIKPLLEGFTPLRFRQTLDAITYFGKNRLWHRNVGTVHTSKPREELRVPLHQSRHGVG